MSRIIDRALLALITLGFVVCGTIAATEAYAEYGPVDADAVLASSPMPDARIVWTDDPRLNCGAAASHSGRGGCYRTDTPGTIYVSTNLRGDALRYVILHEAAHAAQHRDRRPLDECEADRIAVAHGASRSVASYLPTC